MKHLKLFKNTNQYESYKNGSDYVLPNVSYVEETKGVKYERKKPKTAYTLRATYNATPDNLVAFTGATNIKSLTVNGTSIKVEPIKNEITTFDVLGQNISMNMETGAASFPESYLIKSPMTSWSFKAKDPNYVINENTYACMLEMMDGMTSAQPMPLEEVIGNTFTTNDGVTLEVVDELLDWINQSGTPIGFTLADMDLDNETFTFIDTEHQINVTTGGLPTYSFDSEGFYDVKIDLADPNIKMAFTATSLTSIEIGNNITSIGGAFYECYNLTSITIPNSVTSIGDSAFRDCTSLPSITIPDSVTSIGDYAFYDCTNLISATIGDGVTMIGDSAFRDCSSLTSITIPDSVTEIKDQAFNACTNLTSVTIPDSVTTIGAKAFYRCMSLTNVTIPDSVTSIGKYAFGACGLTSITIPNSITSIEDSAFGGCESLTRANIPNSVTSIGKGAFSSCLSLTNVNIPNSVTSIGKNAFYRCNFTNVTIPNSVTSIEDGAFYGCDSLTSVTIGNGVTSIEDSVFWNCVSLTSVYCKATTPPALGETHVFDNNGSGRKIYVPTSSVSAYKSANGWSKYASAIVGYNF